MNNTRYVVVNEHTLGYIYPAAPRTVGILHGSVLRGATLTAMDGTLSLSDADVVRDATPADFADFRVQPPPGFVDAWNTEREHDAFAEGTDDSDVAFARHRELDPHCTCNDCMEYHERNMKDED